MVRDPYGPAAGGVTVTGTRVAMVLSSMFALAALDFVGALAAKEYAERHRPLALILGVASFVVLFGVYVAALKFAELSIVTMGWIVMLQVALLAVDQRLYGLQLDARQWAAVGAMLALQCYLIVSTSTGGSADAGEATDSAAVRVTAAASADTGPAPATDRDAPVEPATRRSR